MTNSKTYTGRTYNLGGLVVREVAATVAADVRFMSQKQLFALGTPAALAELQSRVPFVLARKRAA